METNEISQEEKFQALLKDFKAASNEDIVDVFNPENAAVLPVEVLAFMEHLTDSQIEALAKAYPNKPTGNTYLTLKDTNLKKQLGQLSTWENLFNLRTKGGVKSFVAATFTSRYQPGKETSAVSNFSASGVQDLTKTEAQQAEGLQAQPSQNAQPVAQEGQQEDKNDLLATGSQTGAASAEEANKQDASLEDLAKGMAEGIEGTNETTTSTEAQGDAGSTGGTTTGTSADAAGQTVENKKANTRNRN